MLLGGLSDQPEKFYETSMDVAKKHMFFRPMVPGEADILISGNIKVKKLLVEGVDQHNNTINNDGQGQHLACFIGGMMGIGSKIFARPDDLAVARKLVDGCIWAYNAMPTGIMPESFHAIVCSNTTSCPYVEDVSTLSKLIQVGC